MKLVITAFVFSFFYILFIGYFIYTHEEQEAIQTEVSKENKELFYSSDSYYLVSVDYQNHIVKIIETATGNEIKRIVIDNKISDIAFSPDDRFVAYRTVKNQVKVITLKK